MSGEETVVPFLNAAAKRANDELIERMKGVAANQDEGGDPNIDAVTRMLEALEGMQVQIQSLIDLAIAQDERIQKLEKAKPGRIIGVR